MSSPLPVAQYLVAFGNNAYDDPATISSITTLAGTAAPTNLLAAADAVPAAGFTWQHNFCTPVVSGGVLDVNTAGTAGLAFKIWTTNYMTATPGARYSAVVVFGTSVGHTYYPEVAFRFYDSGGGVLSGPSGPYIDGGAGVGTSYWGIPTGGPPYGTVYCPVFSAPAGAATMALEVYWPNGPVVNTAETQTIINAAVYSGTGHTTYVSSSSPATAGYWTDITSYVLGHRMTRGRQYELVQFQAGTLDLDLRNNDGTFSRWNTSSPLYGLLSVRHPVRYRVQAPSSGTWYNRFTGVLTGITPSWPDAASQWVKLAASDAFRLFASSKLNVNQYQATVTADGAACLYRLGDATPTLVDALGTNPSGSVFGAPTFGTTGPFATDATNGISLKGSSSDMVSLPPQFAFVQTLTASALEWWAAGNGQIISQPCVATGGTFTVSSDATGVVTCSTLNWGTLFTTAAGALPQDGAYHHMVLTETVSGTTFTFTLYIDSVYVGGWTYISGSTSPTVLPSVGTQFLFGPVAGSGTAIKVANVAYYPAGLTTGQITAHYNAGTKAMLQESSGARVGEVLDAVGWPAAARALDTGASQIQPTTSTLTGTFALAHLQAVEQTEAGALFMNGSGQVTFLSRTSLLTGAAYQTSQATFGDQAGEITFQPGSAPTNDDQLLYNTAEVTRTGGSVQVAISAASRTKYGPQTYTLSGLLSTTDAEALARAQYAVSQYQTPVDRMPSVTTELAELTASPTEYDTIFGLELMERITVNRHQVSFSEVGLLEQIAEVATPDSWTVTHALSPADLGHYWIAGDATYGLAGQTTVAAF